MTVGGRCGDQKPSHTRRSLSSWGLLVGVLSLLSSQASANDGDVGTGIRLTEAELRQHDGSEASIPIYLAINGTIFDVSASPAFYGPGGHYSKAEERLCGYVCYRR